MKAPQPRSERILVVDDQGSIRQLIRAGLRQLGFGRVSEAEDGQYALEQLRVDCVDLVILDGTMPRLDGIGTLSAIREDRTLKHLPVIMLTGRADAAFVRQAKALGVSSFMLKPFTVNVLGERINTALSAGPAAAAKAG